MEFLRTPDRYFEELDDFPFEPHYLQLKNGARMHYIDEGQGEVILCLHGEPSWSYLYRQFIPVLAGNYRIIAPDWLGFGRSDKPSKVSDYSYTFHFNTLLEFIQQVNLKDITLVVQDWGGLLGLGVLGEHPEWFKRVVVLNTYLPVGTRPMPWSFRLWKTFARWMPNLPVGLIMKAGTFQSDSHNKKVLAAYEAPFPSKQYKAGAKAFPLLVPEKPSDEGVQQMQNARLVLSKWEKPALVMFSDKDPIMKGLDGFFRKLIPSVQQQPEIRIKDAGHFLQEDKGTEIAKYILDFMKNT